MYLERKGPRDSPKVEEMDVEPTLKTEEPIIIPEEKNAEEEAQKQGSVEENVMDATATTTNLAITSAVEKEEKENNKSTLTLTEEVSKEHSAPVDDSTADDHAIALALSEGYDLPPLKKQNTNQGSAHSIPSSAEQVGLPNTIIDKKMKEKKTAPTFTGNPKIVLDDIIARSKVTPSSASDAREWLAEVSHSIRSLGIEHCACADLLLMYARTQRWFHA